MGTQAVPLSGDVAAASPFRTRTSIAEAGGPAANPYCPSCDMVMFHVASVEHHVRDYSDGWRSVFVCEDCRLVTCNTTGWN